MQSFRGAGGGGAYFTPLGGNDVDALGECEHRPLVQDTLSDSERRLERVLVGVATVVWIGIGALVAVWLV
jgi:hypothetical protein